MEIKHKMDQPASKDGNCLRFLLIVSSTLASPDDYSRGVPAPMPYHYGYGVNYPYTGDAKEHKERTTADGLTEGEFRWLQPNGLYRVVRYYVNGESGFIAKVTEESGPAVRNYVLSSVSNESRVPAYGPPNVELGALGSTEGISVEGLEKHQDQELSAFIKTDNLIPRENVIYSPNVVTSDSLLSRMSVYPSSITEDSSQGTVRNLEFTDYGKGIKHSQYGSSFQDSNVQDTKTPSDTNPDLTYPHKVILINVEESVSPVSITRDLLVQDKSSLPTNDYSGDNMPNFREQQFNQQKHETEQHSRHNSYHGRPKLANVSSSGDRASHGQEFNLNNKIDLKDVKSSNYNVYTLQHKNSAAAVTDIVNSKSNIQSLVMIPPGKLLRRNLNEELGIEDKDVQLLIHNKVQTGYTDYGKILGNANGDVIQSGYSLHDVSEDNGSSIKPFSVSKILLSQYPVSEPSQVERLTTTQHISNNAGQLGQSFSKTMYSAPSINIPFVTTSLPYLEHSLSKPSQSETLVTKPVLTNDVLPSDSSLGRPSQDKYITTQAVPSNLLHSEKYLPNFSHSDHSHTTPFPISTVLDSDYTLSKSSKSEYGIVDSIVTGSDAFVHPLTKSSQVGLFKPKAPLNSIEILGNFQQSYSEENLSSEEIRQNNGKSDSEESSVVNYSHPTSIPKYVVTKHTLYSKDQNPESVIQFSSGPSQQQFKQGKFLHHQSFSTKGKQDPTDKVGQIFSGPQKLGSLLNTNNGINFLAQKRKLFGDEKHFTSSEPLGKKISQPFVVTNSDGVKIPLPNIPLHNVKQIFVINAQMPTAALSSRTKTNVYGSGQLQSIKSTELIAALKKQSPHENVGNFAQADLQAEVNKSLQEVSFEPQRIPNSRYRIHNKEARKNRQRIIESVLEVISNHQEHHSSAENIIASTTSTKASQLTRISNESDDDDIVTDSIVPAFSEESILGLDESTLGLDVASEEKTLPITDSIW